MRWATLALATIMAGIGIAMRVARAARESRALAAAEATSVDAPNVLYIILDTVRARSLSAYGAAHRTSPVIDQLADRRSALRSRLRDGAAGTLPSHATLMSGVMSPS